MSKPLRVLVLEDRPSDAELMLHQLRIAGFDPVGRVVDTEVDYLENLKADLDVILADYVLPDFNALRALELLRDRALDVPFIVVTGSITEEAAVAAVKMGAADYLLKDRLTRLGPAVENALEQAKIRREKRAAEGALGDSERLYRTLFNGSPVGLVLVDADYKVLAVNDAFLAQGGRTRDDLLKVGGFLDLLTDAREKESVLLAVTKVEVVSQREVQLRKAGGETYYALLSLAPVTLAGRRLWQVVAEDITEKRRAEIALRESEKKLRTLVGLLPVGVSVLDAERKITYHNPALSGILGMSSEGLLRGDHNERTYLRPDGTPMPSEEFATVRAFQEQRAIHNVETGVVKEDGSVVSVDVSAVPVPFADWKVIAVTSDITTHKREEEEIRRRAAELALLNDIISTAASEPDLPRLLKTGLDRLLEVLRLDAGLISVEEAIYTRGIPSGIGVKTESVRQMAMALSNNPMHISDASEEGEADDPAAAIRQQFARVGIRAAMAVPVMAYGRAIGAIAVGSSKRRDWSQEERSLVESVGGQLGGAAQRLRLMEQTQEQANQLQRILDTVPEGILTLDANRRVVLANPAARSHLSLLAELGEGEEVTRLGETSLSELLVPRSDGLPHEVLSLGPSPRVFEVYVNASPLGSGDGGRTLLLRDVTEQQQMRRRLLQQERLAAVGQLAAGIAHDFNNMMAAIILYSEMVLKDEGTSAKNQKRLGTVLQQARRAAALTQQVLDFSRRGIMESQPVALVPLVREIEELLTRTLPESIRIVVEHDVDECVVKADPTRIQQVLVNLALNARDAMPRGGELRIGLSRLKLEPGARPPYRDMAPGDWITLTVSDTGVGISQEILPRLFEPFFSTKGPGEGTGLGLAQVYGIVKQHGGYIDVVSRVEEGTTFILYLPALVLGTEPAAATEAPPLVQGNGETILVVEDDPETRAAIGEVLESLKYRALLASNGQEALMSLEDQGGSVDLVLSDLVMPEMGGEALYEALKAKHPEIEMVFMTGYPPRDVADELLSKKRLIWIQKPMDASSLAQVVRRGLERKSS